MPVKFCSLAPPVIGPYIFAPFKCRLKTIPVRSPLPLNISSPLLCVPHWPVFAIMRKLHITGSVLHALVSYLVLCVSCSQETFFYTFWLWGHGLFSKRFYPPFPARYKLSLPCLAQGQIPSVSPELIIRILWYLHLDISIFLLYWLTYV